MEQFELKLSAGDRMAKYNKYRNKSSRNEVANLKKAKRNEKDIFNAFYS